MREAPQCPHLEREARLGMIVASAAESEAGMIVVTAIRGR
jgi:hypothetical protein